MYVRAKVAMMPCKMRIAKLVDGFGTLKIAQATCPFPLWKRAGGKRRLHGGLALIGVVDYGIGNVGSILNMLKRVGEESRLVQTGNQMRPCDGLILPGVGAFDTGMELLSQQGRREALDEAVAQDTPVLGICLGMQMLGLRSEEGKSDGLGYLPFEIKAFSTAANPSLKVPHMGWETVTIEQKANPLAKGLLQDARFYFVHSYYAVCEDDEDVLMTCEYGQPFAAAVHRGKLWGVQFHPEKSHRYGMQLMRNFAEVC